MTHSIVIAYRNRPQHLKFLLDCLDHCDGKERTQIVLVDLASTSDTEAVTSRFPELMVDLHRIPYSGPFHKSKALNYGVMAAKGEFITIQDVDCLPGPTYIEEIEEFFSYPENFMKKVTREVLMLIDQESNKVRSQTYQQYSDWLFHTWNGREPFPSRLDGKLLGCSQFSLNKELFIALGGFDESFHGYGFEDFAHAQVSYNVIGPTFLKGRLWHLWHGLRERDWQNDETNRQTTQRYVELKAKGFSVPERGKDWGRFDTSAC